MAAREQSFDLENAGLDEDFERYGPVDDVDAFIDSQFKFATEGEEEMYGSSHDETQTIRSKMGTRADVCASTGSTLDSFHFSFGSDTLINMPLSPPEEPRTQLCSRCRESMESDGSDGWARSEEMTASEALQKTKGCDGGSEIGTCTHTQNVLVKLKFSLSYLFCSRLIAYHASIHLTKDYTSKGNIKAINLKLIYINRFFRAIPSRFWDGMFLSKSIVRKSIV